MTDLPLCGERRRVPPATMLALALTGCVAGGGGVPPVAQAGPALDPVAFFAGPTHGTGVLHILLHKARSTDVRGTGVASADGGIVLDQDVVQGDGPPKHRRWRLHPAGPGRYTGTLTDAVGPVVADLRGPALHIAFALKGGLRVEQMLYPAAGGRVATNVMTVRKLGVVVARLDERIERGA